MNLPEYDIPPSRTPAIESASPTVRSVDLYLLCFIPSPLFHAHWSIFVPSQAEPQRGTVINVRGDPLHGFVHEFQRGYIPAEDPDKPPFVTKLSSVTESVARPDGPSQPGTDATAYTELERLALSIAAPGPSLGRGASKDGRAKVEIRDCQWWVGQFVAKMVEAGVVTTAAQEVLDTAPRH